MRPFPNPGMMHVRPGAEYVNHQTGGTSNGLSSTGFPTGTKIGDLVIYFFFGDTTLGGGGWTKSTFLKPTGHTISLHWKIVTSLEPFTISPAMFNAYSAHAYRNVNGLLVRQSGPSSGNTAGYNDTSISWNSFTPSVGQKGVVVFVGDSTPNNSTVIFGPISPGFTAVSQGSVQSVAVYTGYRLDSSFGSAVSVGGGISGTGAMWGFLAELI